MTYSCQPHAKEIRVLEIDTGVDTSHPEIAVHIKNKNSILDYFDFNGHGTHIAGLILKNTCPEVQLQSCS